MKALILTVVLLLPLSMVLYAAPPGQYYFRKYTVEQGLSNNTVSCLMQDKQGFIWAGTRDGLNRFDGYHFKTFNFEFNNTSSLGGNFVHAICEGDNGHIWVGTDKGLYKYEPLTESFELVGKDQNYVRDIKLSKDGNLWFISGKTFYTGMALYQYNVTTKEVHKFSKSDSTNKTAICISEDGDLWCASSNGFIEKYDHTNNSITRVNVFKGRSNNSEKTIEKITFIGDDRIMIGTAHDGLKLFNIATLTYKDIPIFNSNGTKIFVRDILKYSTDEYWIASEGGIFIYHLSTGQYVALKKNLYDPYAISDNSVYALIKDYEGGIWVGTFFGGLNYCLHAANKFSKFYPLKEKNSISGNVVREITNDSYGNLWIGTEDAGLNKFVAEKDSFVNYLRGEKQTGLSYSNIHGLLADNNDLWVGTFEHGLDKLDINTGKVTKHYVAGSDPKALKSNFIITIKKEKGGNILIGTYLGLYRYNRSHDNFDLVPFVPADAFVYTICEDHEGTIWVGTIGDGIYYFNAISGKHGNLMVEDIKKDRRIRNNVIDIIEDSKHNLWFSTEGSGVTCYSPVSKQLKNYTSKDGLASNLVYKFIEDNRHNLWMSTSNGLSVLNTLDDRIKTYTTANGLPGNQFNYNSGFKAVDGAIYFGSLNGFIRFNPDHFTYNNFIPNIYITGLQVNNEPIKFGNDNGTISSSIINTKKIVLEHNQSSVSFDFAALSFNAPEMMQYEYQLSGLDNAWTHLNTNRKVYFTNLSPGDYAFKVRALNNSGHATKEVALAIEILSPWWATKVAYGIYALLGLLLIYYIITSYHNRIEYNNQLKFARHEFDTEKALYQMKVNFFTNVAHEIRTPLTLIVGPLEKVKHGTANMPALKNSLQFMEKNTMRLLELTNQLLDFRKIEMKGFDLNLSAININELLNAVFERFEPLMSEKNLDYTITIPSEAIIATVDEEALRKVLDNLLSNAIKYTTSFVHVECKATFEDNIEIEVASNGRKIPVEMENKIFEPFFRIFDNGHQNGTGIGLSIARTLTELHKGKLYLKKTENDQVNIFVLSIPNSQT